MYQPEVKLQFVKRYCNPNDGWQVLVDIDPSEEGRTGGARKTIEADSRRLDMQKQAQAVRRELGQLNVEVGGSRRKWLMAIQARYPDSNIPFVPGDRDIVAINPASRRLIVAEVEGESAAQPETKLYKAIGQIVTAVGTVASNEFTTAFVLVVHGQRLKTHLRKAIALSRLGVTGVCIGDDRDGDEVLFGGLL